MKTDQTVQVRRLILVSAGHAYQVVPLTVHQLKFSQLLRCLKLVKIVLPHCIAGSHPQVSGKARSN